MIINKIIRIKLKECIFATLALFTTEVFAQHAEDLSDSKQKVQNVLFIAIEDFNPEHIGCYGGQAITPNIDQLASEGVIFRNAFVDVAVCNPSRTALLTGLRPPTSGVFGNADDWKELALPKIDGPLPQHFKNNGYETVKAGKIFHHQMGHPDSWSKELPERIKGRRMLSAWQDSIENEMNRVYGDVGSGFFNKSLQWGPVECKPEEFRDGHSTANVINYLSGEHEKPFFLAVGFHATHLKFGAPRQFFELYDVKDIQLPDNPPNDLADIPTNMSKNSLHSVIDSLQWRDIKRAQFACMSYLDWCIGEILSALKTYDLDNNTAIVLWTDHGFMLGEHFQWSKGGKPYSENNEVACIWRVPGVTPKNVVSTSIVETIDFFPTMFDLCNISIPPHVQGESYLNLLKNPTLPGKKAAFTWAGRNRVSIQTERFRLNVNRDLNPASFELYDHKYDPDEYINVSCNPQYEETIQTLISYYLDHKEKYGLFENE